LGAELELGPLWADAVGLPIVASIAAIHGGTVTARPRNDGGLSVTVTMPNFRLVSCQN